MADNLLAPYSYPVSEFTTPDEMRQERISQALGWDTTQPSARFRETLVRHLPVMLGFIGPRGVASARVNSAIAAESKAFDDYMNAFGYPPAPGLSVEAMRRWVDWRGGTAQPPQTPPQQMRLNTEAWSYEPVAQPRLGASTAVPSSGPPSPRPSLSSPEQLTPHIFDRYGLREPSRPQGPWDPGPSRPNSPTQGQRDYHALDPRVGEPVSASHMLRDMDSARRALSYWSARRAFDRMLRPPNNRMNSLLPFAGAAGGFIPDEPY